jgi:monoterpene epsilon-lactone hydrolase
MNESKRMDALHVEARDIPVPASISGPAQVFLASAAAQPAVVFPSSRDISEWRRFIDARDVKMKETWTARAAAAPTSVEHRQIGNVKVYECLPSIVRDSLSNVLILELHGGGFVFMGGEACKLISQVTASRFGCRVLAVDYRMPPEDPYPAALDDALMVYKHVVESHRQKSIFILGSSAGGNLAAALALRARDEGLAPPSGLVLLSPQLDLTESGDSFQTNVGIDVALKRGLKPANELYANGHDLRHPYVSPLFGDFTRGFPRTLVQSGTRDLFLSNAARLHQALRRADVSAELHVLEALPHGRFFGAPEDADFANQVAKFLEAS